jgi:hypothetical protein
VTNENEVDRETVIRHIINGQYEKRFASWRSIRPKAGRETSPKMSDAIFLDRAARKAEPSMDAANRSSNGLRGRMCH